MYTTICCRVGRRIAYSQNVDYKEYAFLLNYRSIFEKRKAQRPSHKARTLR